MNWRGRPLISHEVIVQLIASTGSGTTPSIQDKTVILFLNGPLGAAEQRTGGQRSLAMAAMAQVRATAAAADDAVGARVAARANKAAWPASALHGLLGKLNSQAPPAAAGPLQ